MKQLKPAWIIALSLTRNKSLFSASSPSLFHQFFSQFTCSVLKLCLEVSHSSFLPAFSLGTSSKELISMYSLVWQMDTGHDVSKVLSKNGRAPKLWERDSSWVVIYWFWYKLKALCVLYVCGTDGYHSEESSCQIGSCRYMLLFWTIWALHEQFSKINVFISSVGVFSVLTSLPTTEG